MENRSPSRLRHSDSSVSWTRFQYPTRWPGWVFASWARWFASKLSLGSPRQGISGMDLVGKDVNLCRFATQACAPRTPIFDHSTVSLPSNMSSTPPTGFPPPPPTDPPPPHPTSNLQTVPIGSIVAALAKLNLKLSQPRISSGLYTTRRKPGSPN